ncbi:MAG TPA: PilW family protein [Frateuria sp.]|uniref:PilW family protein n=1 Tax=Frateuria sp. TaxID=2211372 RepID=UPI002DECE3EF|nr:PilW family protein [Frateuria sp.]
MMVRSFTARGVTLIELMVAMVLGLLVAAGIVTVFLSTSSSNRAQNQLAQLQEDGRFAITRITQDLRHANGLYCSNTGGVASSGGSGLYMDGLRAPKIYAVNLLGALSDVTTQWGANGYPAQPTAPYYLPAFLSMRGYGCGKSTCTPDLPSSVAPAMGKAVGARVVGASVVTMRYLDSSRGWAIGAGNTSVMADSKGAVTSVAIKPASGEPAISEFGANDLAMLADCSNAQVFAVDVSGGGLLTPRIAANFADTTPTSQQPQSALKLFDFNTDLLTVSYFLQVVDNGDGQTTGALMRRQNGQTQELVRGVERLDFLYGVEDNNGNTQFLTASQVDNRMGNAIGCPTSVLAADGSVSVNPAGCLWRAVKSIDVRLLMSGQAQLPTLTSTDTSYLYTADGNTAPLPLTDAGHAIKPNDQGFAAGTIRREFNALVSLRNYNP